MAVWRAVLLLMVAITPASSSMVTSLPGGGRVEVETGSRGQVCMYITDDWGTIESTKCTSSPGTYTLVGRGGGQARVTVSAFGGVSVNTGYFQGGVQRKQYEQPRQVSEEEENNVRFGAYENPRPPPPRVNHPEAASFQSPPAQAAQRLGYRRRPPPLRRRHPSATPTLPPVRVPLIANTVRPTFGPLVLPQGPPVAEGDLGSVEIIASGPGQLTVFGSTADAKHRSPNRTPIVDSDSDTVEVTGPSTPYRTPNPLVARKKRNRLSAKNSSDGDAVGQAPAGGGFFSAVGAADSSTVLHSRSSGHRLTSARSGDGSSVLTSQQDGNKLRSVQSADGSSVLTSQTANGQRLGLVRSPDGSVVFSTFIDGRLVNVVRSSDGSSVVTTNVDGRQVTALTSSTGQRLIAGAGPGHNLDAFFNRLMLQLDGV